MESNGAGPSIRRYLAAADELQRGSGLDNADALIAAERQQVFAIPGDDEIGLGGQGASKHVIVVGIIGDDARHIEGFGQFDRLDVIGHDVRSGATDEG